MPQEPSPNFDEHVTLEKTDSVGKGGVLYFSDKIPFLDWMIKSGRLPEYSFPKETKNPSDGSPVRWLDLLIEHDPNLPPNGIVFKESVLNGWKDRFPDFGEWAKEEMTRPFPKFETLEKLDPKPKSFKEKILDSLNYRFQQDQDLKSTKMGKKKKQAEIERLKQVVERLEAEKAEILEKQLNLKQKQLHFDLEAVQGILARHGKVGVTVNEKNPEFFRDLNSHTTVVITLNC